VITDPSAANVAADLKDRDFLCGRDAGQWRVIAYAFPTLDFAISATEPNGASTEYGFRADLSNYPAQAPLVRIWDHAANCPLPTDRRPKGDRRVQVTFQAWASDTVYRPWERMTGPHNGNAANLPHLAWRPERRLGFIFRDLHAILNSNARAQRIRASA
jgi:hypothetical protein